MIIIHRNAKKSANILNKRTIVNVRFGRSRRGGSRRDMMMRWRKGGGGGGGGGEGLRIMICIIYCTRSIVINKNHIIKGKWWGIGGTILSPFFYLSLVTDWSLVVALYIDIFFYNNQSAAGVFYIKLYCLDMTHFLMFCVILIKWQYRIYIEDPGSRKAILQNCWPCGASERVPISGNLPTNGYLISGPGS